jgi:succinoglycan biosynthesis protein ExoO
MNQPSVDVSVIVAAWKAAETIEQAVASALASVGVSVEVIVVDDASPDETMDILRRMSAADARVIAESLSVNSGPSAARNRAIDLARGRYVAVLDADDALMPERLASLVAIADRSLADIVVDNMIEVDEAGRRIGDAPFLKSQAFALAHDITLSEWIRFNQPFKRGGCLGYLKPLISRLKLSATTAIYDSALRNSEDYHLLAHLLASGARMTYTPEAGYIYRRSASSISHRLRAEQTRALLEAEDRFQARFAGSLSREERALLRDRKRGLRGLHQFVCSVDAMKAGKPATLASLLASDLRSSAFTMSTFARIAMGKVLRRKMV